MHISVMIINCQPGRVAALTKTSSKCSTLFHHPGMVYNSIAGGGLTGLAGTQQPGGTHTQGTQTKKGIHYY